ncbi:N(4)-(Beta-N-acetylglucosaminyl)-L-asparaginase-like [Rhynchophorus ferrugineus]|uniref:N(4)-(Beta-N-acetylglucosaminyl)-L-asparaginase- like n=1 Tax=Rhynchophorus ferrugineus TaxID=354439 RepID=UPI003FCD6A27
MILYWIFLATIICCNAVNLPVVINTWAFTKATENAWNTLIKEDDSISALVDGCKTCQDLQCDYTVGYGGSPDENGETTLDALIFDGNTMDMGAVGGLRQIKNAIGVARKVLENTKHSFLVGELATDFAKTMGFPIESLETNYSLQLLNSWLEAKCQPNFWANVSPDPSNNCGPYKPIGRLYLPNSHKCRIFDQLLTNEISQKCSDGFNSKNHDTIGMLVINKKGHIVAGTSTNGANHKIPGRVGDSPIAGAGAYADSDVGASAGTGDGDIMMRFLPSFLAVEQMRLGKTPEAAAQYAISRIAAKYPTFFGGIIAVNKKGIVGAACNGMDKFPYSIMNATTAEPVVNYAQC